MRKNLLIIGAGQYGILAGEVAAAMKCFDKIDYLDDKNVRAIGTVDEYKKFKRDYNCAFVAVGDTEFRMKWISVLEEEGYDVVVLVHPNGYVSSSARLSCGTIVEPMAVVQANSVVGKGVLICSGAVVKHNAVVEDGCYLDCNGTVASNVTVPCGTKIDCNVTYR